MPRLVTIAGAMVLILTACSRLDLPVTRTGSLVVSRVVIPEPIITRGSPDSASMAAYLTIANEGDLADTLIAVESPLARHGTLHGSMEHGGMMAMTALALPAHSVTRMAPGGTHLMFEGLSRAFVPDDQVPLVLVLARAGRVSAIARVVSYTQFDALRGDSVDR